MNKPSIDEAVSAMLDDALSRQEVDQVLDQCRLDPREGERLARYSLIGMVMRGELAEVPSRDMTARIMACIRAEQCLPARRVTLADSLREALARWRMPALGLALAASVAGVAVLVIQPGQTGPDEAFVVLTTPGETLRPTPVEEAVEVAAKDTPTAPQESELLPDPYLVQHLTHAEGGPMTSNVRLVAYERP